jgi:hypothetical protein
MHTFCSDCSLSVLFSKFLFWLNNALAFNSDTVSYFTGVPDLYRTPVYPLLIKAGIALAGDHLVSFLVTVQIVSEPWNRIGGPVGAGASLRREKLT